jgi:hypothetical protein
VELQLILNNHVTGHRFPTGSAFFRQVWAALRVTDGGGTPLFVRDGLDEPDAGGVAADGSLFLSARLIDARNVPTQLPWRAVRVDNNALQPLESRTIDLAFDVPPSARGPLLVEARLHFRTFPAELLRELDLPSDLGRDFEISDSSQPIALTP